MKNCPDFEVVLIISRAYNSIEQETVQGSRVVLKTGFTVLCMS